jgi:hypothetical protein
VLVVQGASSTFNPTLDLGEIAAAREADPQAAVSEWEGQFRSDLSGYLDEATLDAAIDRDRPLELAPRDGVMYQAFVDSSGGVGADSYTLALSHKDGEHLILDVVRGTSGKF